MPNNSPEFEEILEYLYSRLPVFQLQGKAAFNYKLEKTYQFLDYLGNPHQKLKYVHVAGTNGKGSVSHMISSVMQEAGYQVGLYTSPHLKSFTERIKINGKEIGEAFVVNWVNKHKSYIEELKPSFFEATVAMSLDYFHQSKVDLVVLEVGMGGRLDSTNVVSPELSVITNISYDHAAYLGDTLEKIAFEKAGIIKQTTPVVIGETQPEIEHLFRTIAKEKSSPIHFADQIIGESLTTDLKGSYQQKNTKTAHVALKCLKEKGWEISDENIKHGIAHTVNNTGLKGRWQQLSENPKIICDTGHNEAGIAYLMDQIKKEAEGNMHFVMGFVQEKALENIFKLFPKDGFYYFCGGQNSRLASPSSLKALAETNGLKATTVEDVNKGIVVAKSKAKGNDFIFVGGSTFVVAEIEGI